MMYEDSDNDSDNDNCDRAANSKNAKLRWRMQRSNLNRCTIKRMLNCHFVCIYTQDNYYSV